VSLEAFKQSAKGTKLAALFASDEMVAGMIRKSEAGRPAVEAIGREVAARVGRLDDEEKKLVGRWAKEVLVPKGWVPERKGRVAPGHFFSRGTIYRRVRAVHAKGDGRERLAAAQAIVAKFSKPPMSSDELIDDRRRAFRDGE
jgi:hypothetical protein